VRVVAEVRAESGNHGGLMETIGWALLETRDDTLSPHLYEGACEAQDSADLANGASA
jgi:hypothetical protein